MSSSITITLPAEIKKQKHFTGGLIHVELENALRFTFPSYNWKVSPPDNYMFGESDPERLNVEMRVSGGACWKGWIETELAMDFYEAFGRHLIDHAFRESRR